jgi:hypothetical protein
LCRFRLTRRNRFRHIFAKKISRIMQSNRLCLAEVNISLGCQFCQFETFLMVRTDNANLSNVTEPGPHNFSCWNLSRSRIKMQFFEFALSKPLKRSWSCISSSRSRSRNKMMQLRNYEFDQERTNFFTKLDIIIIRNRLDIKNFLTF